MNFNSTGSIPEDAFIELFSDTFGAEKASFLYTQYPFYDIYQNSRFADFVLESGSKKIAIEIDDEASHNKSIISQDKFTDHLLRQNSMVHLGFDVFRFAVKQIYNQPETIKDELRVFLGTYPSFKQIENYLPTQKTKAINGKDLELKEPQLQALKNLEDMRANDQTIALLYHATGTGKTTTAVIDAKNFGKRTLFLAHTHELVEQATNRFNELWSEVTVGKYVESIKQSNSHVVCGSIQSVALNLEKFKDDDFDYLIIDEAHHASADTYQKVLSYFKPKFILGLTATPERTDDNTIILDIFKNTAHRLDIETAVEIGELVPVRCFRIHTNIDLTNVRFNALKYNIRELENKIFVPERNNLIVKTWIECVKNKKTLIFCASVKHAEEIAELFRQENIPAFAVSGNMKSSIRHENLEQFAKGDVNVLCACDLLNEGWDCPETEVLFMARPTMSKMLYTQQLGRGMRLSENKDSLIVFDFVDNASQYNSPQSLHRLFKLKEYNAGGLVLAPQKDKIAEQNLYARGEKPILIVDYPINALDYEFVDIFNWQDEADGMLSQIEFVRRVDVQMDTIEKFIKTEKLVPDLVVPMSEHRTFKYFKEETLEKYAKEYNWTLINDENRKDLFIEMIKKKVMTYSYKPVFIKALLLYTDKNGRVPLSSVVSYFREFYLNRKNNGLIVEKSNSIYIKEDYTDKESEQNILKNPFKRFEDMNMINHTENLGIIEIDRTIWKHLSKEDKENIQKICDESIAEYYNRLI